MILASEIRQKYLDFFKSQNHAIIPSAPLVPENDPSVLFNTAGMQPLVPYLLGEPHPLGKRLADVQKCVRTGDIDDVGDDTHLTFFEMLGNWSLGDYFKKESIEMSWEFLTSPSWLALDPEMISVTVFQGDANAPRDEESAQIWKDIGMPEDRIAYLPAEDNWWAAGPTGPCGPDTEIFYWMGEGKPPRGSNKGTDSKMWMEIWNNVFMQYNRVDANTLETLPDQCVDTGMGIERCTVTLNGYKSVYETDCFASALEKIREIVGDANYDERSARIIADHIRTATHMISDGVLPKNIDQGYILRRLIRRAIREAYKMGYEKPFAVDIASLYIEQFENIYDSIKNNAEKIKNELEMEEGKFAKTIKEGLKEFQKLLFQMQNKINWDRKNIQEKLDNWKVGLEKLDYTTTPSTFSFFFTSLKDLLNSYIAEGNNTFIFLLEIKDLLNRVDLERMNYDLYRELMNSIDLDKAISEIRSGLHTIGFQGMQIVGNKAFTLFDTYGFPLEMTLELAKEQGLTVDIDGFKKAFEEHQELSRTAAAGKFKGGLADDGADTTALHSACHLMLAGLREVLGTHVTQAGSNITAERLRFDFTHGEKMTPEQIKAVEDYVNEAITSRLTVTITNMDKKEAQETGVSGSFWEKYPHIVKVYSMVGANGVVYSRELCGGPHVENSENMGKFKIVKEESSSSGVRRIKAVLEK